MDEILRETRHTRTTDRITYLKKKKYNVIEMWECEFKQLSYTETGFNETDIIPPFTRKNPGKTNMNHILKAVKDEELFGMVEVDIEVPEKWKNGINKNCSPQEYFSEMSPIFCTSNVGFDDMGEHMQDHVRQFKLSTVSKIIWYFIKYTILYYTILILYNYSN